MEERNCSEPSPKTRIFFPYRVCVEPRLNEAPKWLSFLLTVASGCYCPLVGAILIALGGGDPVKAYVHIGKASFGSLGVFSDTMVKAIPLMLVGLACSIAFRMKLWNIGAEGQFFLGAFGASVIVLLPVLPATTPKWIFITVMMLAGMLCGALWGIIPGILKVKFNVNEIISTLMMNYIAVFWNNYFIYAVWSEAGFQMSKTFAKNAWLPRISELSKTVPVDTWTYYPLWACFCPGSRGRDLVYSVSQQMGLRNPVDRRQCQSCEVFRHFDWQKCCLGDGSLWRVGRSGRYV